MFLKTISARIVSQFAIKTSPKYSSISGLQTVASMSTNQPKFEYLTLNTPKEFVYHVEINRPDKANSLNRQLFEEIPKCFDTLSLDEDCRVVVFSGAGDKIFCGGIDLNTFMGYGEAAGKHEDPARKAKVFQQSILFIQNCISSLARCKKPVIAAVHGGCIGAGAALVTSADIRYSTKDAYFQVKEVLLGLAADIGTLQRLPKILGSDSLIKEWCYTGRKMPAAEALSSGLISRVYEDKNQMIDGAIKIAEEIAKNSPVAVQTSKASLQYSIDHTVEEGLEHVALLNQLMLQSEDLITAATAQITKDPNVTFSKL